MELELDELPPLDDNPEDLVAGDILETPVRPPPSFLDEDAPLQLSDEEDADAEKLVQVRLLFSQFFFFFFFCFLKKKKG
jgi:hypothetical protein